MSAGTRSDHNKFCRTVKWEKIRDSRGRTVGHHITYELPLFDGRRLRTRVSKPANDTTYGPNYGTPSCANAALIFAKSSKIGEPLGDSHKDAVRDKDLGDLWQLMVVAEPSQAMKVVADFLDYREVGIDFLQSVEWTTLVLRDLVSRELAKSTFDTFVNPVEIDSVFDHSRDSFWTGVPDR